MQVVLDVSAFQTPALLDHVLRNADDEIVAVYVKATQGLHYTDEQAAALVAVTKAHETAVGYYDFMTNDQALAQEQYEADYVKTLPPPDVRTMLDCEGSYAKWAAGVINWEHAAGKPLIEYAQLSNWAKYASLPADVLRWVAQYDYMTYYRPQQSEIDSYRAAGYTLWQFTSNYMGLNLDASILLTDFSALRAAS